MHVLERQVELEGKDTCFVRIVCPQREAHLLWGPLWRRDSVREPPTLDKRYRADSWKVATGFAGHGYPFWIPAEAQKRPKSLT